MSEATSVQVQIPPHGGKLVERRADPGNHQVLVEEASTLPPLPIDRRTLSDLRLLAVGALSPLDGFMSQEEYASVVDEMRLPSGLVWSIPITLPVSDMTPRELAGADRVVLTFHGRPVAILDITEVYTPNKEREAKRVYGVDDPAHPGVHAVYERGEHYIAGPVVVLDEAFAGERLLEYALTPRETRRIFAERGWKSVVAFQTRNPIHRAHEYLQKCALELVDGLLLHPLIGETKADDVDAETRFACYETMLSHYYPKERVLLSAFPASMRYAGPREAIFHAICRKNYGCTHFIVGRDHAGVGNYYGTYDAQEIFDRFTLDEIGIVPLRFEHAFYCRSCSGMATLKTCPHDSAHHVFLSGTKVRAMLREGETPPPEFTRPEVAQLLLAAMRSQIENGGSAHGSDK